MGRKTIDNEDQVPLCREKGPECVNQRQLCVITKKREGLIRVRDGGRVKYIKN